MSYKQLELFQPMGEHEFNIFEQAKVIKGAIQKLYNSLNILDQNISRTMKEKYGILKFNVQIDLIGDREKPTEPSTPKVFIWQFVPSIELIIDDDRSFILNPGSEYRDLVGPKIIPKWINSLFTSKIFSKTDFQQFTSQYFILGILSKLFSNADFVEEINSKLGDKQLIVYFENKLFPKKNNSIYPFLEKDMLNKISNYYVKIKNSQQSHWFFVGCYDDFTDESELIVQLDQSEVVKSEIKTSLSKQNVFPGLVDLFQNDYLFLNNSEFFQNKTNTSGWNSNCIVPPNALTKGFSQIKEVEFNKTKDKDMAIKNKKRKFYCYLKKEIHARFSRNEILLPERTVSIEQLEEIVSITQKLNKG